MNNSFVNTLKNIFRIMASENLNIFIYYFKRIPLLGRLLPDAVYAKVELKTAISVVVLIITAIANLVKKSLYIVLMIILPAMLIVKGQRPSTEAFVNEFFFLSIIIGSFKSSEIFTSDVRSFTCIRLMRMDAKKYYTSTLFFHDLGDFFLFLPSLMIFFTSFGGTALQGFLLALFLTCSRFIGEAFFLLMYDMTGASLVNKTLFISLLFGLGLASAYVPLVLHSSLHLNDILFSLPAILVIAALALLSIYKIIIYNKYQKIAVKKLKATDISATGETLSKEMYFKDVTLREKNFSPAALSISEFDNKQGFDYLNAIFFKRHRWLLVKPILLRLGIIVIVTIAFTIVTFLSNGVQKWFSDPTHILPPFVFIMYISSIGERVCKAMFHNCDISLLHYPFYREKKAILSNFKVRLFRIANLNFIIAMAISLAVICYDMIFALNWTAVSIVSFISAIFALSLFFSVHHLFLYYVFQPYTTQLTIKNPFFKVINFIVYMLSYTCLQIKSPPSFFAAIILFFTITYVIVALILVYKMAPKNFRVQ